MIFESNIKNTRSIRTKLTFIISALAIFAITLSSVSIFTFVVIKKTSLDKQNLVKLAHIMADNLSASIVFEDNISAQSTLNSLRSDPNIKGAFLLLKDYSVFASYLGEKYTQDKLKNIDISIASNSIDFDNIIVSQPIYLYNKHIASLILVSSTKEISSTLLNVLYILLTVFIIVLLTTLLISSQLKQIFTIPIYALIEHIQDIVKYARYDKKITQKSNDEFQILYDGFNTLLETIDKKTKELQLLASVDPMTKLYNRRYLSDTSEYIMELSKRNKTPLSIIMIDIDFFKKINDKHGHKAGDAIIIEMASTLKSMIRASDIACRFGGEEFLVLLPETDLDAAIRVAQKIRKAVEHLVVAIGSEHKQSFTVSCGVSNVSVSKEKNIEPAINRADQALYEAKENGRNKVISKTLDLNE